MSLDIGIGRHGLPQEYSLDPYSHYDEGEVDALETKEESPAAALNKDKMQSASDDPGFSSSGQQQQPELGPIGAPALSPPSPTALKSLPAPIEEAKRTEISSIADLTDFFTKGSLTEYDKEISKLPKSDLDSLTTIPPLSPELKQVIASTPLSDTLEKLSRSEPLTRPTQEALARGIIFTAAPVMAAGIPVPENWSTLINKVREGKGEAPIKNAPMEKFFSEDSPTAAFSKQIDSQVSQIDPQEAAALTKSSPNIPLKGQLIFAMAHPEAVNNPPLIAKAQQIKSSAAEEVKSQYNLPSDWSPPISADSYDRGAQNAFEAIYEEEVKKVPDKNSRQQLTFAFYHPDSADSMDSSLQLQYKTIEKKAMDNLRLNMGFPDGWQPSVNADHFDLQAATHNFVLFSSNLEKAAEPLDLSESDVAKIKAYNFSPEQAKPLPNNLVGPYEQVKKLTDQQLGNTIGAPRSFPLPQISSKAFEHVPSGESRDHFFQEMKKAHPEITPDQYQLLNHYFAAPPGHADAVAAPGQATVAAPVAADAVAAPVVAAPAQASASVEEKPFVYPNASVQPAASGTKEVKHPLSAHTHVEKKAEQHAKETAKEATSTDAPSDAAQTRKSTAVEQEGAAAVQPQPPPQQLPPEIATTAAEKKSTAIDATQNKYGLQATWHPQPMTLEAHQPGADGQPDIHKNAATAMEQVKSAISLHMAKGAVASSSAPSQGQGISIQNYYFIVSNALSIARDTLYMVEAADYQIAKKLSAAQQDSQKWHMQQIKQDINNLMAAQQQAQDKNQQSQYGSSGGMIALGVLAGIFLFPVGGFAVAAFTISSVAVGSSMAVATATGHDMIDEMTHALESTIDTLMPGAPNWLKGAVKAGIEATMLGLLTYFNPMAGLTIYMNKNMLEKWLVMLGMNEADANKAALIIQIVVYVVIIAALLIATVVLLCLGQAEVIALDSIAMTMLVTAIAGAVSSMAMAVTKAVQYYFEMRIHQIQAEIDTIEGDISFLTEQNKAFNKYITDLITEILHSMGKIVDEIDAINKTEIKIWQQMTQIISDLFSSSKSA